MRKAGEEERRGEERREGHFAECCFATGEFPRHSFHTERRDGRTDEPSGRSAVGANAPVQRRLWSVRPRPPRPAAEVVKKSMKRANSIAPVLPPSPLRTRIRMMMNEGTKPREKKSLSATTTTTTTTATAKTEIRLRLGIGRKGWAVVSHTAKYYKLTIGEFIMTI